MGEPTLPATTSPDAGSNRHLPTWPLWALFFLLVIYPLSTGPVIRLTMAGYLPKQTENIYIPIGIITKAPMAKAFFEWYIFEVWKVKVGY